MEYYIKNNCSDNNYIKTLGDERQISCSSPFKSETEQTNTIQIPSISQISIVTQSTKKTGNNNNNNNYSGYDNNNNYEEYFERETPSNSIKININELNNSNPLNIYNSNYNNTS